MMLAAIFQFGTEATFIIMQINFGGYYWLLYLPIFGVRLGLYTFTGIPKCRPITLWKLFSYRTSKGTALYLQACIWQIFFVSLLLIRPVWFYNMVSGTANSPCGKSSCSRDADFNMYTGDYKQIYNPAGWFPTGEYEKYDKTGTTDYTFCDFGEACRWADHNMGTIQLYEEMTNPQCTPNYDKPVDRTKDDQSTIKNSVATKRLEDYHSPGTGILGGFYACKKDPKEVACPGNIQEADPITRKLSGRRVCSVCGHYKDSYKAVIGVEDSFGHPDKWANPDIECAAKADGSVNVWCFICPSQNESTNVDDLTAIVVLNAALIAEAFICIVIIARGVMLADEKECEEQKNSDDDGTDGGLVIPSMGIKNKLSGLASSLKGKLTDKPPPPATPEESAAAEVKKTAIEEKIKKEKRFRTFRFRGVQHV